MIKFIKNYFQMVQENISLKAQIVASQAAFEAQKISHAQFVADLGILHERKLKDLDSRFEEVWQERKDMMEWILEMGGAPSRRPAIQAAPTKTPSPFVGARNARDYQRIADQLENQVTSQEPEHPAWHP